MASSDLTIKFDLDASAIVRAMSEASASFASYIDAVDAASGALRDWSATGFVVADEDADMTSFAALSGIDKVGLVNDLNWGVGRVPTLTPQNARYAANTVVAASEVANVTVERFVTAFAQSLPRGAVLASLAVERRETSDEWLLTYEYACVRVVQERIEVTAMGDASPQYMPGLKRVVDVEPEDVSQPIFRRRAARIGVAQAKARLGETVTVQLDNVAMDYQYIYGQEAMPSIRETVQDAKRTMPEIFEVDLHPKRRMTFDTEDL